MLTQQPRALGVGPEQRQPEHARAGHDDRIDREARHVATEHAARILDHVAHDRGRDDAGQRVKRAIDRDDGATLRYRRELAQHRRADHISRSAEAGANHEKRDLQTRAANVRHQGENRSADNQRHRTEHPARAAGGEATRHHELRDERPKPSTARRRRR